MVDKKFIQCQDCGHVGEEDELLRSYGNRCGKVEVQDCCPKCEESDLAIFILEGVPESN